MLNSELQWIERESDVLLSGIMKQTIQDIEIIVFDSGSTNVTVSIASRYPVKILSIKPDEFSFGWVLNIGCQAPSIRKILMKANHSTVLYE